VKRQMFEEVLGSVREAGAILRGQRKPSRRIVIRSSGVRGIRERASLSQSEFADLIGVSVKTLQDWEQGRPRPTGPAAALLSIIEHDPALAVKAILWRSSSRQRRDRAVAAAVRKGSPVQLHDPDPYWECPVDRRK
jgi:putative transcriptional regulator